MPDESPSKSTPPYLPYKTFLNSLANLEQGMPPKIDRSIWKNQPGTVQSQILSAYKFLGLTDEHTHPTPFLKALVESRHIPTATLKPIIEEKYSAIFQHNLATMTTNMLGSEFEAAFSVDGETKKKGIRFFLQAAKANGIALSKFLLDQTRASTGTRKKRANGKKDVDVETVDVDFDGDEEAFIRGTTKMITLRSGGQLSISLSVDLFDLSTEDRTFVFALIDDLRGYEAKKDSALKA